jgi:hypothetical protein
MKYLLPNKAVDTCFESKKNMMIFSDSFPSNYKELLGDKFYRIGVTQSYDNLNISFFTSFLTLLADNYMTLLESEEMTNVNKLINEILEDINNNNIPNSLKDIVKGALKKYVKEKEVCIWLLEMLVHKFMINILIFDFKTNGIYTLYPNDVMNPWRPFLLFAKSNNNWEPIRNQDKKLFSYNDPIIKKILGLQNIEIKYYDNNIIKKDYFLLDNINEIILNEFSENNLENTSNNDLSSEKEESETNNTFMKNIVIINKNKLNKMTKEEIINYMKEINKNVITTKKTTKKELIELVLSN